MGPQRSCVASCAIEVGGDTDHGPCFWQVGRREEVAVIANGGIDGVRDELFPAEAKRWIRIALDRTVER